MMTRHNDREIELKYRTEGYDLDKLWALIKRLPFLKIDCTLEKCITKDFYFPPPAGVSMIRLRDSAGVDANGFNRQLKEITVKKKDHGDNFNRLEENVAILDSLSAYKALQLLHGAPLTTLYKHERVLFTADAIVVSVAEVNNSRTLFVEVEGPTEQVVNQAAALLTVSIKTLTRETRSLIEIYAPGVRLD